MNNIKSQNWFFIMGVLFFMIGCASRTDSTKDTNKPASISATPEAKSLAVVIKEEGWGKNPRDTSSGNDANGLMEGNWYTKKYSGKANERSIELKSPSYMESTCRQAIKKENGRALIEASYISSGVDIKPEVLAGLKSKITSEDLKNIEVSNCNPTSSENTFSECECLLSYKAEGGKKAIIDKIK